jgi:Putative Actinobacterial Holin-X, holin superfamily III
MAYEHLKQSALPRALSDVIADLADLVQKEMRLAREELSNKLSLKLRGGVWIASAGGLALIAGLLVIEAAVFGIASFGVALHWSCLIVAAILAAAAGTAYALGRSDLAAPLTPDRTIRQFKKDVTTAREQVS